MNTTDCCDVHCTSCRICYLKLLRPGDTVPFKKGKYILPLSGVQCLLAVAIIVLDTLAIYSQSEGVTSPPPSFLGSPGIPMWLSIVLIGSGFINIAASKRNTRFSTALAFGFSSLATLVTIILLAIITLAICEEQKHSSATGITVAIVICTIVLCLLFITSLSALSIYMSISSHDDRWFTDRGTQYDSSAPPCGSEEMAKLTVPSGQPAFLFYAPSAEALKYSGAFENVIKKMERKSDLTKGDKAETDGQSHYYDNGTHTELSDEEGTYVITPPSSATRERVSDKYMSATSNV